jgi:hypothetical protein
VRADGQHFVERGPTLGVGNETAAGKMYGLNLGCLEGVSDKELAKVPVTYVDGRDDPTTQRAV